MLNQQEVDLRSTKYFVRFESPMYGIIGPTIGPFDTAIRIRDCGILGIRRVYVDMPIAELRSEMPGGSLKWRLDKLFKDGGPIKYDLAGITRDEVFDTGYTDVVVYSEQTR